MSAKTGIQWCDATFNPWIGCTHVSPGCENCYAEVNTFTRAQRAKGRELWGAGTDRHIVSEAKWGEVMRWNDEARKAGRAKKVFCASMADVFEQHPAIVGARHRLFSLVEATEWLTWQFLTKRPENVAGMVPLTWLKHWPKNAWLGASVEDRARLFRLDTLRALRMIGVGFVSFEPLLQDLGDDVDLTDIAWAIFGFESGSNARPGNLAWIRRGVERCRAQGTAPFVKQFGARPYWKESLSAHHESPGLKISVQSLSIDTTIRLADSHGGDPSEWPAGDWPREFPKVAA